MEVQCIRTLQFIFEEPVRHGSVPRDQRLNLFAFDNQGDQISPIVQAFPANYLSVFQSPSPLSRLIRPLSLYLCNSTFLLSPVTIYSSTPPFIHPSSFSRSPLYPFPVTPKSRKFPAHPSLFPPFSIYPLPFSCLFNYSHLSL